MRRTASASAAGADASKTGAASSAASASSISGTTTKIRCPSAASERTRCHVPLELVRAADARPDRDAALGWRPEVGHVEVGVEDLAERARDRRRGHQQDVRCAIAAGLRLEQAALLHAEPVLLVDHDDAERRERHPLLDERVRPDDDRRLAGRDELERLAGRGRGHRARQQLDGDRRVLEQRRERPVVLAGEEVGRGEQRSLHPGPRRSRQRVRRDRRLARAHVALEQSEHRRRAGEVAADVLDRPVLVDGQHDLAFELPPDRPFQRLAQLRVGRIVDGDRPGRVPPALSSPGDHAQLERQQLVERQPPERRVATLERDRVVGLFQRVADRGQLLAAQDIAGQVFRVRLAGPVEQVADRDPQPVRGEPRAQAVDRHDPPDVEQLVVLALGLEVGVVERQLPAEPLQLAADDDLVVDVQPSLDEAPPEPRRLDRPGLVLEDGDRPLDAAPERRLDADVDDPHPRGDDGPLLDPDELAELAHLAKVVVAPRQVEQQVANREEPEPPARPPEDAGGRDAGLHELRVEEDGRIRRDGDAGRRGLRSGARRRSRHLLLGGDQVAVVGLPAVDDFDLGGRGDVVDLARHRLGLGERGIRAVVERDQLVARPGTRRPPRGPPCPGRCGPRRARRRGRARSSGRA